MIIHLDQIRDDGLRVDEPLSRDTLDALLKADGYDTGFHAVEDGRLTAELRRVGATGVLVKGEVRVKLGAPCRRCLADVTLDLPVPFSVSLTKAARVAPPPEDPSKVERAVEQRERRDEGESAGSFALDAADEDVFDGKKIDLDPIYREQLLLAVPMNAECREDCQGLCGQCGQNLNDAQCGCDVRPVDPRLASLKNFKLN